MGMLIKDIREIEKEGDALVRRKDHSGAARKFGEAAVWYGKEGFGTMAAAAESKRITAVNNAKSGTDDHSAVQSLQKWAGTKGKK